MQSVLNFEDWVVVDINFSQSVLNFEDWVVVDINFSHSVLTFEDWVVVDINFTITELLKDVLGALHCSRDYPSIFTHSRGATCFNRIETTLIYRDYTKCQYLNIVLA